MTKTTLRYIGRYQRLGMLAEVDSGLVPQLLASGEWESAGDTPNPKASFRKELEALKLIGPKLADKIISFADGWESLGKLSESFLKTRLPDNAVELLMNEMKSRGVV